MDKYDLSHVRIADTGLVELIEAGQLARATESAAQRLSDSMSDLGAPI